MEDGSDSSKPVTERESIKKYLGSLDIRRKALESESEGIVSELTTKPDPDTEPMGIDTPLIDHEGYPRGDIDIFRCRTLRHRLAEIRTDHSALMKQIEHSLLLLATTGNHNASNNNNNAKNQEEEEKQEHAARMAPKPKPKYDPKTGKWVVHNWDGTVYGAPKKESTTTTTTMTTTATTNSEASSILLAPSSSAAPLSTETATSGDNANNNNGNKVPFARIDSVAPQSPAEAAGLQENDLILQFGTIEKSSSGESSKGLFQQVAQLVPAKASENQSISILVSRQQTVQQVSLTPRPWNGRGLIGCHIVPYND